MKKKFLIYITLFVGLLSCEEPAPLTSQDLIDNTLELNSDFPFSAYVDVFPFISNNVSFTQEADSTYKIIARNKDKDERIEINLPYLKIGTYIPFFDRGIEIKFFSEIKEVFSSETEKIPSDFLFVISKVDSSGSMYSGSFSATTYLEKTNQPANRKFQRLIGSGKFKDILLE